MPFFLHELTKYYQKTVSRCKQERKSDHFVLWRSSSVTERQSRALTATVRPGSCITSHCSITEIRSSCHLASDTHFQEKIWKQESLWCVPSKVHIFHRGLLPTGTLCHSMACVQAAILSLAKPTSEDGEKSGTSDTHRSAALQLNGCLLLAPADQDLRICK